MLGQYLLWRFDCRSLVPAAFSRIDSSLDREEREGGASVFYGEFYRKRCTIVAMTSWVVPAREEGNENAVDVRGGDDTEGEFGDHERERERESLSEKWRYESTRGWIARRRGLTHCGGEIWVVPIMSGEKRAPRSESDSGRVTPRETSYISCITNVRIYHLFVSPAYVYFLSFFSPPPSSPSPPPFFISRNKMYAARVLLLRSSGMDTTLPPVLFEYDAENARGDFSRKIGRVRDDALPSICHAISSSSAHALHPCLKIVFLWFAN